jgi:hypothetical protein
LSWASGGGVNERVEHPRTDLIRSRSAAEFAFQPRIGFSSEREKSMSLVDQPDLPVSNITPLPSAKPPQDGGTPADELPNLLQNARHMLLFAGDEGIQVDEAIAKSIIVAGSKKDLTNDETLEVIKSITSLMAKVRSEAHKTINRYFWLAAGLGIVLILITSSSFIAASYSKLISDDITVANQYALDLNAGNVDKISASTASVDKITDISTLSTLQRFAATIREIRGLAAELHNFVFWVSSESVGSTNLELVVPVTYGQIKDETEKFQTVRAFAKGLQNSESAWYGAIANGLLPPLYAILGALAFLLKTFSEEVKARSFRPSRDTDKARLLIAAIGGGVIGLFSSVVSPGTSLPLLAIAFLVGYATDVFFIFLDGLEQVFAKARAGARSEPTETKT